MDIKQGGAFAFTGFTYGDGLHDADSLPAGLMTRNGADDTAVAVTVTHAGTGRYALTGTVPASYAVGDSCQVVMLATVGGNAGGRVVGEITVTQGSAYAPYAPSSDTLPVSTNSAGFLVLPLYVGGAGDAVTLTDGNGTVVYQGAGLGVAVAKNSPLDPGALPGDPDSPGEQVAWAWDLSGVATGAYAGLAACTGVRNLAVSVGGAASVGTVTTYSIALTSDPCPALGSDALLAVAVTGSAAFTVSGVSWSLTDWAGADAGGLDGGASRVDSSAAALSHTVARPLDTSGLLGRYLLTVAVTCDDGSGLPQTVAWEGVIGVG